MLQSICKKHGKTKKLDTRDWRIYGPLRRYRRGIATLSNISITAMLPRVEGKNELFGVEVIVDALISRQVKRETELFCQGAQLALHEISTNL